MMNADKTLVVRTYHNEAAANIAASRLRSEGIEAHMQKDDCGGAYPSLQMIRGVRLLVHPEDREEAEKILSEMEAEDFGKIVREEQHRDRTKPRWKSFEALDMKDLPSQQLDELKSVIFMYVLMAPLLSALFADKIDNIFVACLLFVGLVGSSFVYLRKRLAKLEDLLKEQELRLRELEGVHNDEFE